MTTFLIHLRIATLKNRDDSWLRRSVYINTNGKRLISFIWRNVTTFGMRVIPRILGTAIYSWLLGSSNEKRIYLPWRKGNMLLSKILSWFFTFSSKFLYFIQLQFIYSDKTRLLSVKDNKLLTEKWCLNLSFVQNWSYIDLADMSTLY